MKTKRKPIILVDRGEGKYYRIDVGQHFMPHIAFTKDEWEAYARVESRPIYYYDKLMPACAMLGMMHPEKFPVFQT